MTLFYGQKLNLIQPDNGYRLSIDSILLASTINIGTSILDVGCGVGAAGLCVKKRRSEITLTGIDIQKTNIDCAFNNSTNNNLEAHFIEGDIKTLSIRETFDHVMSNPPFYEADKVNLSDNEHKRISNVLNNITLEEWIKFCIKHSSEWVTIIHLPEHLEKILSCMNTTLGDIKVFPIWTKNKAKRVIIQGSKKRKAPLTLLQGLTLQDENGYTKETDSILRDAKGIFL